MLATEINLPDWVIPGIILIIIGGVMTVLVRAVFHSFREWIKEWFENILAEVKPNGGNTDKLGDQVLQIKASVQRVEDGVAGIYPRIDSIEAEQERVKAVLDSA